MNLLSHRILYRPASKMGNATCTERTSADFLIDGQPLLEMLVKYAGGHSDFMGCFVSGYAEQCRQVSSILLDISPEKGARVLLYICPECGDVGCGAYSALVRRDRDTYIWEDFAYQMKVDELKLVEELGPFVFEAGLYEAALLAAAEIGGAK